MSVIPGEGLLKGLQCSDTFPRCWCVASRSQGCCQASCEAQPLPTGTGYPVHNAKAEDLVGDALELQEKVALPAAGVRVELSATENKVDCRRPHI